MERKAPRPSYETMREDLNLLRRITLFEDLRDRQLQRILACCEILTCDEGEPIITEGEQGEEMYILRRGEVEIIREVRLTIPGKKEFHFHKRLAVLHEGDYFGELALLESDVRSATVKALSDVELWGLASLPMQKLMREDVDLGYKVVSVMSKTLCARLRSANTDIGQLLTAFVIALNR